MIELLGRSGQTYIVYYRALILHILVSANIITIPSINLITIMSIQFMFLVSVNVYQLATTILLGIFEDGPFYAAYNVS